MMQALIIAAMLAAPCAVLAADVVGTITVLEGQALIYRGSGRVHAAEGVRVEGGDIVETAAASFAQVELNDRSLAQFGPATRVMLDSPPAARQNTARSLYLMDGWLKWIGAKPDPAAEAGFELRSAQFEIPATSATFALRLTSIQTDIFVESGGVRVTERQPDDAAPSTVALATGDFYQRRLPERGRVAAVAPAAFVGDMPRAFRDTVPPRLERFRNKQVAPKDAPAFNYADVQSWLQAERDLRRPLMRRWRQMARQPEFRAAIVANLRAHPEWHPILFPEKYRPKPVRRPDPELARSAINAEPAATPEALHRTLSDATDPDLSPRSSR